MYFRDERCSGWLLGQQPVLTCPAGDLGMRPKAEFVAYVGNVALNGPSGDDEFVGNLAIGVAARDKHRDFPLAVREVRATPPAGNSRASACVGDEQRGTPESTPVCPTFS